MGRILESGVRFLDGASWDLMFFLDCILPAQHQILSPRVN